MWSVARFDLGISTEEFHALRPTEFEALCDRLIHNREQLSYDRQHRELMLAQLTAAVINTGFCRPEKPVKVESLMPSRWAAPEQKAFSAPRRRPTRRQREKVADDLRAIMANYLRNG